MIEPVVFMTRAGAPTEGELALPEGSGRAPGIIVVHEFFGLNEDMRAMCKRLAQAGYLALAVDLYGGEVTDKPERAMQLVQAMKTTTAMEVIGGAVASLISHPRCTGRVGITGFCLGGAMALAAACNVDGLAAVVPFYGLPMAQHADWSKVRAPIQGHFAENDAHVQKERVEKNMKSAQEAGASVELHFYSGGHGFMRDSDPRAYHEESARLAWERMMAFFKKHLGDSGAA